MKVTLQKIVNSIEQLNALQSHPLPAKTSYRIMRLVNKLDSIIKTFTAKRNELIKELGAENVETKQIAVKPENLEKFNEKINEILSIEEEVDFEPINPEDLGDTKIPAKDLPAYLFAE